MPPQFVYTMKGLGKVYPPDSQVLKDIWLSFLPGAKIGVLGLNGAGKSTLLKIMAGVETNFIGEAFPGQGVSIGFLQQEPQLNPAKDVRGNVEEGVAEIKALMDRYDAVNIKLGEDMSPEEMDKVLDEQSRLQDRIDATNAWDLDSRLDLAMDALRLPPPDADVTTLSGGERRRLDSRARSRPRHSIRRQLHRLAGTEAEPPAAGRKNRKQASAIVATRA